MTPPRRPVGLGPRGRALWRQVTTAYAFDPLEVVIMIELCRTVDVIEALAGRIAADPAGSPGLLVEIRMQRDLAGRLARQLRLPAEAASSETDAAVRLGRRGAARRWGYARPEVVKGA